MVGLGTVVALAVAEVMGSIDTMVKGQAGFLDPDEVR